MKLVPGIAAAAFAFLSVTAPTGVHADVYPSRPVTFVVPNAAGGSSDLLARAIGKYLSETLKQPVVVENKPGASEMVATDFVARAAPDGHTIAIFSNALAINETISDTRRYDAVRDLVPVAKVAELPLALLVSASFPAKNLKEFVAHAKANPGKLDYAHLGTGTPHFLTMEKFKREAGIDIVAVPYKSSSQIYTGLLGGEIGITLGALGGAVQFIQRGNVRALASMSAKRPSSLPDLPTVAEAGFEEFNLIPWMGIFVPAGTPPQIVSRLEAAVQSAVNTPEVRSYLLKGGLEPATEGAKEFGALVKRDIANWRKVIEDVGAKP